MAHKFHKKVAVISGGGGYIGSAITRSLRDAGMEVVSLSRKSSFACDIRNAKEVREVFADIRARFGAIDACIHAAAAPLIRKNVLDLTATEFQEQMDGNVVGAFNLFKEAVPLMQKGGTIVGITTQAIESSRKIEKAGAYVPAKYALRGLLRTLASQLAPEIRVYAISPGFLPGGLNADMPDVISQLIYSKLSSKTSPEEIGELAKNLIAGESSYPSGSSIQVPESIVSPL